MPVVIPVQADDSQFRSAMGELQGEVTRSAKKVSDSLEDMANKGKKSNEKLSESEEEAAKKAKEAAKKAKEASKGFEDLGDAAGFPVDKIKKLRDGFGAVIESMTPAQIGMVAFGGAAVAAAASAAVAVGAVVAFVDGVVSLTRASAAAVPDLLALQKASGVNLIPSDTVDRVQRANAALDAVGASASATGAVLSGQLSPYIEKVSTLLIAANLALADFLATNTQIVQVVADLGVALVDYMIAPIKGAILLLGGFLAAAAKLADLAGSDLSGSLKDAADSLLLFGATDFEDNVNSMTGALGAYVPAAQAMIGAQVKLNTATATAADTTGALRDALFELQNLMAEGQIAPGTKDIRDSSQEFGALSKSLADITSAYGVSVEKSTDYAQALVDLKLQAIDVDTAFARGEISQAEYEKALTANAAAAGAVGEALAALTAKTDAEAAKQSAAMEKAAADSKGAWTVALDAVGKAAGAATSVVKKVMSAIGFDLGSIMAAVGSTEGPQAAIKAMADQAKAFVAALPAAIQAFSSELPGVIDGLVAGLPKVFDAIAAALPLVIGAIIHALPSLFDAIKSSIPALLATVAALLPGLIISIVKELPGLVKVLAKQLPILVDALLAALPSIIMAILDALPLIIVAIVQMIPDLAFAIIKNLPAIIKALVVGIFKLVFVLVKLSWKPVAEAIGRAVEVVADKVRGWFASLKTAIAAFFQKWIDVFKEVFTFGLADTSRDKASRQYGDTPGARRVGPQGETFRASPGDIFALARSPQGLMDQAAAAGGSQRSAAPSPVLVLSDHGRAFDGLNFRIQRAGGGLAVDIANRARMRTSRG